MKHLSVLCFLCLLLGACINSASEQDASEAPANEPDSAYDEALAREVGADSFGMKQYVMAFLKVGPNRSQDSTTAAELQHAHLDNIKRMAEAGQLVLAGPFLDDGEVRGIYIFDVNSVEEARALTATDPAIKAGRLEMELHPWYGSAVLVKLNEMHSRVAKESF